MAYKKPKISYNTIRKNTNLDKFTNKKSSEEDEKEIKTHPKQFLFCSGKVTERFKYQKPNPINWVVKFE